MKAPDKKTETKLERERDRAQTYLDGAGVMIVALDQAGNVALINKRGCEILGYAYDDIVGKNWFETFLPEYDRPRAYKAFCQIMAGDLEPVEYFENQVVTRTGEERFMAWHSNFVTDATGKIVGTLTSGEDVTERRRTKAALQESEERYRVLAESSLIGVYLHQDTVFVCDKLLKFHTVPLVS